MIGDRFFAALRELAARADESTLTHRIVTEVPPLLGCDRAVVYRYAPATSRLVATHASPDTGATLIGSVQPFTLLPAFMRNALSTGMQAGIPDLDRYPLHDAQRRHPRFERVRATLYTPFLADRQPAGMLVFDAFSQRDWDEAAKGAARKLGALLAAARERTKRGVALSPETTDSDDLAAQLSVLSNLAGALAGAPDVPTTVAAVEGQLRALFPDDRVHVILGADDPAVIEAIEARETLLREIPANGEGPRGRIIVPVVVGDRALGAIDVEREERKLATGEARFLGAVANLTGSTILAAERFEAMRREAITDALTGIANHRHAMETASRLVAQTKGAGQPLSLLMVDIDRMRDINNAYGHRVGDEVLRHVAHHVAATVSGDELAARYGGEEFCVLLPGTSDIDAQKRAREILNRVAEETRTDLPPVTVSVGIATSPTHAATVERLFDVADKALYIAKYGGRNRVVVAHRNVNTEWEKLAMDAFVNVVTSRTFVTGPHAIEHAVQRLAVSGSRNLDMALALAQAVDVRDKYTSGHSHAVSNYALKLAKALRFREEELEEVRLGALLHDVGKIGTPEAILGKTGPLDDAEYEVMKRHPADGAKILAPIPAMKRVADIVETHQEYYNGTGYPHKLRGEKIPKIARIVSIADAYHAMVSTRPYRKGMPVDRACGILADGAGKQWDPRYIETFIALVS